MLRKIRKLLNPPVFQNSEKTRQASTLHMILLILLFGSAVGVGGLFVLLIPPWPVITVVLGSSLVFAFYLYLLHRGYVLQTIILTGTTILLLDTWLIATSGGVASPLVMLYAVLIMVASTIVHPRAGFAAAVVGSLSITAIYLAGQKGILPAPVIPITPASNWVQILIFLFIFAALTYLSTNNMYKALHRAWQNEQAVQHTADKLQAIRETLEQRVAQRTQELEERSRQLQTAAEVGHAIAAIREINELLATITRLVSDHFGYYHIGIFLLDEVREYAVLKAASSPGGQLLLARGYHLKVDETSIVGYVAAQREPRIVLDIENDPVFSNNPALPDTRSEMALPLIVGDQLLGVLDVHSVTQSAFSQNSVEALQVLADQVAIAVYNAQLYTQSEEALQTLQQVYGEISREAWQRYLDAQSDVVYRATEQGEGKISTSAWPPEMAETLTVGKITRHDEYTLHIPIILRNQILGVVRLRKQDGSGAWSENEIKLMDTLVDQLEAALETARLYNDIRQQAQRERIMQEVTDRLHRTMDMDTLMQTLLQEVSAALDVEQAFVQLSTPPGPAE